MSRKCLFASAVAAASAVLAACGGGGGGGGTGGGAVTPPLPPPSPYASNCVTTPDALSCRADRLELSGAGAVVHTASSRGVTRFETVFVTRNDPSRIDDDLVNFVSGAGVVTFSETYTHFQAGRDGLGRIRTGRHVNTITDIHGQVIPGSNGNTITLFDVENVLNQGLDYVQLGRVESGETRGTHTYFAVGRTTHPTLMPATGSARYSGATRGTYQTRGGAIYQTAAELNMNADFASGQISGSTASTKMIDADGAVVAAPSNLNFNFTASINGVDFTGAASSSSMSGTVSGRFHCAPGGAPTEVGLAYSLDEAGGGRHVGAGGAKRQ